MVGYSCGGVSGLTLYLSSSSKGGMRGWPLGCSVNEGGFWEVKNGYDKFFSKAKLVGKSRFISTPGKGLASKSIAKGSFSTIPL